MNSSLFPFTAIVGMDLARHSLIYHAIDRTLGGTVLMGHRGCAKSTMVRAFQEILRQDDSSEAPFVEVPLGASEERLLGSVDAARLVEQGEWKEHRGLLEQAHDGVLYVDEVNLLPDHLVDQTLDAVASSTYADGDPALPDNDNRVSLQVSWTPFAGGAISARKAQAEAERNKLLAQLDDARTGIALEVRKAVADYRNAQSRYRTARLGLDSAQATRRTRAAQWDVGELGIQELLEAESDVARKRAEYDVAGYRKVSAWVALQGALGAGDRLYDLPAGNEPLKDPATPNSNPVYPDEPASAAGADGGIRHARRSMPVEGARSDPSAFDVATRRAEPATAAASPAERGAFGRLARFRPIEWRAAYFTPRGPVPASQLKSANIGVGRLRLSQWQPPSGGDGTGRTTNTNTKTDSA